ncbi:MAG TPA: hypothetical protein GXX36_03790 [Clostridiaceae bacterium]|nr:hypothetical protein [Clostridiaceae bacterium]
MKNKKTISILLITVILVSMAFSCVVYADDSTSFDLSAESSVVKIGEEITLTVKGKNVIDLNAYEVNLTFDEDKLEYVKAESIIDGYSVIKNNNNGLIIANAKMGNAPAENGNIDLCTITFKGKKTGNAAVKLSSVKVLDNILAEKKYTIDKTVFVVVSEDGTFIPVTKIEVKSESGATSITTKGGELQMIAIVTPENATIKNVTWSVENVTGKATISETGLLKAVSNGKVIVKATATDGSGVYGTCEITITGQTGGTSGGYVIPIEDDSTEIEAKPDANGVSNAQFGNRSLKKAIENAKDGIAKLKVTGTEDAVEVKVNIPAADLGLAKDKGIKKIEVDIGFAVISVNPEVLRKSDGTAPSNIDLSVKKVDTSNLSDEVKSLIGDSTVYDFSISTDGKAVNFGRGDVTLAISYKLKQGEKPENLAAYFIDDKGELQPVENGRYNTNTGKFEFEPDKLGKYIVIYTKPDEVITFSDIDSVPWAKEAIETFAAMGVVNGMGDGTFRPHNNVTRAEFTKILMMAFGLIDENAVSSFSDVKEGAWYYKPIASAEKLGIVKGKGDGTFGVNEEILRQDIAVMLYRTAQYLGIDLDGNANEITFTDEADISGYAKEAVAAMQKAGIIKGIGDGSFAPKKLATRAEATVMIYRLFMLKEE